MSFPREGLRAPRDPGRALRPATAPGADPARAAIYLHPGQLAVAAEPSGITTILGSCVAVCLFDPSRGVGGMNHFLLPHAVQGARFPSRFGSVAIVRLIEQVVEAGAEPRRLQAKVFGGACVVEAFRRANGHLGMKNVEMALERLEAERIPVVARDIGGNRGRKLVFQTDDGMAWVKFLK